MALDDRPLAKIALRAPSRLLWVATDVNDARAALGARPRALVCALSAAELGAWRDANRWADAVEAVRFSGDDGEPGDVAYGPRDPRSPLTPYRVGGAPSDVHRALGLAAITPFTEDERDELGRYLAACYAVACFLPSPTWFVRADSDGGLGAVEVAHARRAAVALAADGSQPSAAACANALRLGVDVVVRGARARGLP